MWRATSGRWWRCGDEPVISGHLLPSGTGTRIGTHQRTSLPHGGIHRQQREHTPAVFDTEPASFPAKDKADVEHEFMLGVSVCVLLNLSRRGVASPLKDHGVPRLEVAIILATFEGLCSARDGIEVMRPRLECMRFHLLSSFSSRATAFSSRVLNSALLRCGCGKPVVHIIHPRLRSADHGLAGLGEIGVSTFCIISTMWANVRYLPGWRLTRHRLPPSRRPRSSSVSGSRAPPGQREQLRW